MGDRRRTGRTSAAIGIRGSAGSNSQAENVRAAAPERLPERGVQTVEVFTCADGLSIPAGIEIKGQEFTAVGELVSGREDDFTVRAFPAQIFASLTPDASISGSFLPGDMVRTSGFISNGRFFATNISPACGPPSVVTEITGTPAPPVATDAPVVDDPPELTAVPAVDPADIVQRNSDSGDGDDSEDEDSEGRPAKPDKPDKPDRDDDEDDRDDDDDDEGDD